MQVAPITQLDWHSMLIGVAIAVIAIERMLTVIQRLTSTNKQPPYVDLVDKLVKSLDANTSKMSELIDRWRIRGDERY